LDVFVDDYLLFDSSFLRNHCLLALLLHLDGAILKSALVCRQRTIHGTPLHAYSFLL
jgi:hypothetical protein